MSRATPFVFSAAAGLMLVAGPAYAAPAADSAKPVLLAHRAVYDLTLGKSDGSGAPNAARGRIVYEFSGSACEGYVTNFRQATEIQMDEGKPRTSDMRSATFEDGDGSGFRFKTDTFIDGRLMETVDGQAHRNDDGALSINLSSPAPAKADFAPSPVFPTAQTFHIIDSAKAGQRTTEVKIFDGSDAGQKVYDTLTVIGPDAKAPPTDKATADASLLRDVKRWPVSVSYFDPAKRDGPPNYVLAFDLFENGVSDRLRINYGNYTLNGEMTQFELLPQKPCTP